MDIKIVPTILVKDRLELQNKLEEAESLLDRIHLDVADEEFVVEPTLNVEAMISEATLMRRDLHLMVLEPIEYLEICKQMSVDMVIGHIESMSDQLEFLRRGRELKLGIGLAIDYETDFDDLDWSVARQVDLILVMAYTAGKDDQKFNKKALEKVKKIRKMGFEGEICVDGGVSKENMVDCVKAGANVLAMGRAFWGADDLKKGLKELRKIINI